MIHREATIKYKGYDPNELSHGSSKRTCCICDHCGRVRWIRMDNYRDLCVKCAAEERSQNLKWIENNKKAIEKMIQTPEWIENNKKAIEKMVQTPEWIKAHKESIKKRSESEEWKIAIKERSESEEWIEANKIGIQKRKNNPEIAKKVSAVRQGIPYDEWNSFIQKLSYCKLFDLSLKEAVRSYFNNNCFMDNKIEKNGWKLSIHHVNYDKRCGCDATQFCIFIPVTRAWNNIFNGNKEHNRWYWYSFLMNKIFIEHPNYFVYHIPVWGMNELEYNYSYVFEKFRRR